MSVPAKAGPVAVALTSLLLPMHAAASPTGPAPPTAQGPAPAGGSWTTSPPAAVGHTFPGPALATVTLTVTDATGLTGSDTIVVCLVDFTPD